MPIWYTLPERQFKQTRVPVDKKRILVYQSTTFNVTAYQTREPYEPN